MYESVGLGEPELYHQSARFTMCMDITWRLSDCEELSGGYLDFL